MEQEAVLEERQSDRYTGFLVEIEMWEGFPGLEDEPAGRRFEWRVTDMLTGNTVAGPIMDGPYEDVLQAFEDTWEAYAGSKQVPQPAVNPYVDHPNYGRF